MKKIWIALVLGGMSAINALPLHAATLEGQTFNEQIRLEGQTLQLNGLGVRAVFIFRAYVAALYLTHKTAAGQEAVQQGGPKRLQLRMLMDIGAPDIKKALVDGMRKNVSEAQWSAMQERVAQFSRTIDALGATHAGDALTLDYLPKQGLVLTVNEVTQGQPIPGTDFYNALLGIFVGDDPVDTRLKGGLLGQ
jgi:hypothetical protein